jgi:hypothetical protein
MQHSSVGLAEPGHDPCTALLLSGFLNTASPALHLFLLVRSLPIYFPLSNFLFVSCLFFASVSLRNKTSGEKPEREKQLFIATHPNSPLKVERETKLGGTRGIHMVCPVAELRLAD